MLLEQLAGISDFLTGLGHSFLAGETRYTALELMRPEDAKELFAKAEEDAQKRYEHLCKLQSFYEPDNSMDI